MQKKEQAYKCPSCGGDMKYNPSSGNLYCDICKTKEEAFVPDQETADYDFNAVLSDTARTDWGMPVVSVLCKKCGCGLVVPAENKEYFCSFCGTCSQTADSLSALRPDFIIPFHVDPNGAASLMSKWIKKKKLAPFPLKKEYKDVKMRGVYLPYWSFDSTAQSVYMGQAGNRYTETETSTKTKGDLTNTIDKKVRKIRWRFVNGSYDHKFFDMIYGDSSLSVKVLEKLEPYKLNELQRYEPGLLGGTAAELPKSGLKAVWERARQYMRDFLKREIYNTVKRGSDAVGRINIKTLYTGIKFRLLLLPAWIASYSYRNKTYNFYINGQTGEIFGKSPKSFLKISIIILVIAAALAALWFFVIRNVL